MLPEKIVLYCAGLSLWAHVVVFASGDLAFQTIQSFRTPSIVYTFESDQPVVKEQKQAASLEPLETSPFSLIVVSDSKKEIRSTAAILSRVIKNPIGAVTVKRPKLEKLNLTNHQKRRLFINYYQMLCLKIKDRARYPDDAKRKRLEGIVYLSFQLNPSGSIGPMTIEKSSGSALLDFTAKLAVKEASPFPPYPALVSKSPLQIHVPISFEFPRENNRAKA